MSILKKKKLSKSFKSKSFKSTKPKFRSFRSVKINFLGRATIFCTILCLILFFFTYFLSNLAVAEEVINFLSYVIIISFFAALFFATLSIFYHLFKFLKKLYKKIKNCELVQRFFQRLKKYFHHQQQKIKAMDKRPIIAGLVILLGLAVWLLPAFIYNELESKFRQNGMLADSYFYQADESIYTRQQGGASSYYDTLFAVGDEIESQLKSSLDYMQLAQEYNKKQRLWLIFLGQDYKDYHQAKTASFDRYYQSRQQFLKLKEQEHLRNNTFFLLNRVEEKAIEMIGQVQEKQEMNNILEDLEDIDNNIQQLFEQQLIDETLNQYFQNQVEFFLAFDNELKKIQASGNPADFDLSIYQQRQLFDEKMNASITQKMAELIQQATVIVAEMNESEDEMFEIIVGYIEDGLNLDPLSEFLAKFSDDFPRNRMTEEDLENYKQSKDEKEDESEPVKAPVGVIEELVG